MNHRYLISDKDHNPIAQAVLESVPDTHPLHLNVLEGLAETVAAAGDICLIASHDTDQTFRGRVGYRYGDCIVVVPTERLDVSARMNLRVPSKFKSFFYPVSGGWRGQRRFVCRDLSCGGIAFQTDQPLEYREVIEMVIAPMRYPLLVHATILRPLPFRPGSNPAYAAKFINLCNDEDAAIRKAVFSIQLRR